MIAHPNFFIIGAPKCGTTSLANWLNDHERIFFSDIKEPNFYNSDLTIHSRINRSDYSNLFKAAGKKHLAIGEATTGYLRSKLAVKNILQDCPNAKFIICIRNPVDLVISLHSELLKHGIENQKNFWEAWMLQESRSLGRNIPFLCQDKSDLQYGKIGLLGKQVERTFEIAGKSNCLVLTLDEISHKPRNTYLKVIKFLDIPDDGRLSFTKANAAVSMPVFLSKLLRFGSLIKRSLGITHKTGVIRITRNIFGRPGAKPILNQHQYLELVEYFKNDIELLENLLDTDLSSWIKSY